MNVTSITNAAVSGKLEYTTAPNGDLLVSCAAVRALARAAAGVQPRQPTQRPVCRREPKPRRQTTPRHAEPKGAVPAALGEPTGTAPSKATVEQDPVSGFGKILRKSLHSLATGFRTVRHRRSRARRHGHNVPNTMGGIFEHAEDSPPRRQVRSRLVLTARLPATVAQRLRSGRRWDDSQKPFARMRSTTEPLSMRSHKRRLVTTPRRASGTGNTIGSFCWGRSGLPWNHGQATRRP
jgi:hypothetical protein